MLKDWPKRFTIHAAGAPFPGSVYPVWRITTALEWDDIVLSESVRRQLSELEEWVRQGQTVREEWSQERGMGPGCIALFHGQPGTGKTLTAMLLAKSLGRDVCRVDLSAVVSKYIGETEKNLDTVFDRANDGGWILFFDVADALFGRRTEVKDAHDRYANTEVSYFLDKIEKYYGLVILATNLRSHLDDAFLRRFPFVIDFQVPDKDERRRIWLRVLPHQHGTERHAALLSRFVLTGENIRNAALCAAMTAADEGRSSIRLADAVKGIEREVEKEGKVFQNLIKNEMADEEDS